MSASAGVGITSKSNMICADPSALERTNSAVFKDCLAPIIFRRFTSSAATRGCGSDVGVGTGASAGGDRGRSASAEQILDSDDLDASELSDFIDYLHAELFTTLPTTIKRLDYTSNESTSNLSALYPLITIPHTFTDSLVSYGLVDDEDDAGKLLKQVLVEYVCEATKPPPMGRATKKDVEECEICERRVPLTYHHLIPKATHAKVLKRGWHPEHVLNSVAWICRPCHTMCHKVANLETLAREFYTVDKLLQREDIQRWAAYQAKQRWKGPKRG